MIAFITVGELGFLGRRHCGAGEESRAKDAKDAKVKGMEDNENAWVGWSGGLLLIGGRVKRKGFHAEARRCGGGERSEG